MNHPDAERLAALAGHDPEAEADAELRSHVATCTRCGDAVGDLGVLTASLAELPDVAPPRPLRLLPVAADPEPGAGERIGGWVRRFFTPLVTAGVALAFVGAIGTASPALEGMAAGGADSDLAAQPASSALEGAGQGGEAPATMDGGTDASGDGEVETFSTDGARLQADEADEADDEDAPDVDDATAPLPAERSPWPMVLFSGVALVVGVILLRWILAPRAG